MTDVKMPKPIRLLACSAVSILGVLLLGSCGEQPFGIFAAIEREAEAEDSHFVGARLRGMARVATGNGDYYIVASGRPQWRAVDSPGADNWSNAPRPSGFRSSGDWMTSVVTVTVTANGGEVYGLFKREGSSNRTAIFEWDGNTGSWDAEIARNTDPPFDSGWRISRLFAVGPEDDQILVASVRDMDSEKYTLIEVDTDGGGFVGGGVDTSSEFPFSDAAYDDDEDYWFVSRDKVYTGDAIETLAVADDAPEPDLDDPPHDNRGIFYATDGPLYLSADNQIYRYDSNNGGWESVTINNKRSGDRFTRFAEYEEYIYVGSDREGGSTNGGVYKLDTTVVDPVDQAFARETGRPDGSVIYRSHLAEYFVDEEAGSIFALMYSRGAQNEPGLWRRDEALGDWNAE